MSVLRPDKPRNLAVVRLGRSDYRACWDLQHAAVRLRRECRIPDLLLLTEHNPVFTLGTGADEHHVLAGREELHARGIDVVRTNRGGDVTYHGPGQLVGYPILDLHAYGCDLHRYLRDLERVLIETLADFGLSAGRCPGYTGVWIGDEKIAAIGIRTSGWITMHGVALNVTTDLGPFERIIPCGILEKGVTSAERALGRPVSMALAARRFTAAFARVFDAEVREATLNELNLPPVQENVAPVPAELDS